MHSIAGFFLIFDRVAAQVLNMSSNSIITIINYGKIRLLYNLAKDSFLKAISNIVYQTQTPPL